MQTLLFKMRGNQPSIRDISLELQQLVCPVSLECDEVIEPQAPLPDPYAVAVTCYKCDRELTFCLYASRGGIRELQLLLIESLGLLCAPCSWNLLQRNGF